ncbi:hypothetical protein CXR04_12910 [Streptomyces sp. CMB-StM0423]|nr:hypothetical protein CXR04_12910 [Streptomyces sp. CMB-StM0423]
MEWLTRLPVVGPYLARFMRTRPYRAFEYVQARHWSRLAGAVTFSSFVALFPLLTTAAAISAAVLSDSRRKHIENWLTKQVPGISDRLDMSSLFENAGTVGLISLALLMVTGINWISTLRDALRAVWDRADTSENLFLGKGKDALILFGLGGTVLVSLTVSITAATATDAVLGGIGITEGGWGSAVLEVAAFGAAVTAGFLLLVYVLTRLPGVHPPRRRVVEAALAGAVGFELLKLLLSGYFSGVAGRSVYGAFGVPVALVIWINFMARLLLYCAAWTATPDEVGERPAAVDDVGDDREQRD